MVIYVIGHKQINNFKLPKYEKWAGQIKMTRVNIKMTSRVFRMDTTVDNKTKQNISFKNYIMHIRTSLFIIIETLVTSKSNMCHFNLV